jgi:enoyl-CoA hydratase/carnithine racemase
MSSVSPELRSDTPLVLRSVSDSIALVTLNRPQQYNALSLALLDELHETLEEIGRDGAIRAVVLAGAGKAFCAGHDLKELRSHAGREFAERVFQRCSEVMLAINRLPQPVIARVHGVAAAAGCQLTAQCDLAVAATEARFATSGINVGLFCATPSVPLSRNIPRKQAMEMLLTGEFIDAPTALRYGLINRVVDAALLDETIMQFARSIIAKPAVAIAAGKKAFYEQLQDGAAHAYEIATETMVCNLMTEEVAEGIDAFMEKRKPRWAS